MIPGFDGVVNAIFSCIECGDLKDRILRINSVGDKKHPESLGINQCFTSVWGEWRGMVRNG